MSKKTLNEDVLKAVIEAMASTDFEKDDKPMDLNTLTKNIEQWAIDRNLHNANPRDQMLKFGEEAGELYEGMAKGNGSKITDAIGDIYVVLTILSMQLGLNISDCVQFAYNEIKERKGRMINGVFVKESDLK